MLIAWTNRYADKWTTRAGVLPIYNTETFTYAEGTTRRILKAMREGKYIENCRCNHKSILEVDIIPTLSFENSRVFVDVRGDSGVREAVFVIDNDFYVRYKTCRGIAFLENGRYGVIVPPVMDDDGEWFCPVYTIKMGTLVYEKSAYVGDESIFKYEKGFIKKYKRQVLFS